MTKFPPIGTAAHQHTTVARHRGFTLIELLIVVVILGILAAIVVPQFSNASHQAREATLKDDLRFLRIQIQIYRSQHHDVSPGYPGGNPGASATDADFIAQLTSYTDDYGDCKTTPDATHKYGPYLSKMPQNPLAQRDTVQIVGSLPATPDESTGWVYNPDGPEIKANTSGQDNIGVKYFDY